MNKYPFYRRFRKCYREIANTYLPYVFDNETMKAIDLCMQLNLSIYIATFT